MTSAGLSLEWLLFLFVFLDVAPLAHGIVTRAISLDKLVLPSVHLNYGLNSFAYRVISFWNDLPLNIRNIIIYSGFINSLRNYILNTSDDDLLTRNCFSFSGLFN
jgi:hypothetical protein